MGIPTHFTWEPPAMRYLTVPAVAAKLDAPAWLVRELADKLPTPVVRIANGLRLLTPDDVELIRHGVKAHQFRKPELRPREEVGSAS